MRRTVALPLLVGFGLVITAHADHFGEGTPAGTAHAFLDPFGILLDAGEIIISANGVARISLFSAGGYIVPDATSKIGDFGVATLSNPNPNELTWTAATNVIGLINSSERGRVFVPNTASVRLEYQLVGGDPIEGRIGVTLPEPSSLALLVLAGVGVALYRRHHVATHCH